jgi:uncharacterized SAM-binding protein YcdF (DUF218 family)
MIRRIRWVLLFFGVWVLLAWLGARWLLVQADLDHADAIVVLSGSSSYLERTRQAAELYQAGRAPKIILTNDNQLSGWSNELERNPLFAERAFQELQRLGVPADRVEILQQPVASTHDEALLIHAQSGQRKFKSIIFVTSPYHSRRALWTLRRVFAGEDVAIGLLPAAVNSHTPRPQTWWLSWSGWRAVGFEFPKLVYYWIRY